MADRVQPLHFPAGLGINEAVQEQLIEPGQSNLRQENVRFMARGSLGKRFGFDAQPLTRIDGTSRSAGNEMFPYGTALCVVDGHNLDVWDPTLSVSVTRSKVSECGPVQRIPLPTPDVASGTLDSVVANGYLVTCQGVFASGNNRLLITIVNTNTDALISTSTIALSPTPPSVNTISMGVVGTTAFVFYASTAAAISCYRLDCSTSGTIAAGWIGPTTLATDLATSNIFDVTSFSDRVALVYPNTGVGTTRLSVRTFNASATQLEASTITTGFATPSLCACGGNTGDTLWVSWVGSAGSATVNNIIGLNPTSIASIKATALAVRDDAETTVWQHGLVATTTGACTLYMVSNTLFFLRMRVQDIVTTAGAAANSGAVRLTYNVSGGSRPWYTGGIVYAAILPNDVKNAGNTQANLIVADLSAIPNSLLRPVATIAPRISFPNFAFVNQHVPLVSGSKYALMNLTRKTAPLYTGAGGNATGQAIEATLLDFGSTLRWAAIDYNENKYLVGGMLSYFDGNTVREAQWLTRPSQPSTALVGGGAITDTNIKYVCMWEAFDASGNVEWSAISDPTPLISPAGQNVALTIESPSISCRSAASIRVAIYRTTNGGNVFFRVGAVTSPFSTNTTGFTDSVPVATLTAQNQLYKSPGGVGTAQDRFCPPGLTGLVAYNGSLVGIGDDGFSLWQSAQQVIGEATWFNPIWQWPITDDGPNTALAVYDGTLFVFKRRAIYAIQGEAPNDTATQGGLGVPRKLAVDVGCTDPDSVLVTAHGVFFSSDRGIELLDRSLSVEWIGEAIKNTVQAFPVFTSSVLDIFNSLALFTLVTAESGGYVTGNGVTVAYDLARDKWVSVDRVTNFAGTASAPAQSAAIVWNGSAFVYARLDADGHVLIENRSNYLDPNSAWVQLLVELSWLKLGLQQQQRLWELLMLATPVTDAKMKMEFAKDWAAYAASVADKNWTDAEDHLLSQFPARPLSQGQAVKIRISDAAPTTNPVGTGQGFTLIGFSADIAHAQAEGSIRQLPHLSTAVRK